MSRLMKQVMILSDDFKHSHECCPFLPTALVAFNTVLTLRCCFLVSVNISMHERKLVSLCLAHALALQSGVWMFTPSVLRTYA